jgi:hypothetical protein
VSNLIEHLTDVGRDVLARAQEHGQEIAAADPLSPHS